MTEWLNWTELMYKWENWTMKKAEFWRIDAFELWCWRRLLRVPWTPRRSNLSVLMGFPCGSAGKESSCNVGDLGLIPGLGRFPGEVKHYSLQYSGLENSMYCTVHMVAKSRIWVSNFHFCKGNQSWICIGKTEPEPLIPWPPDAKNWL